MSTQETFERITRPFGAHQKEAAEATPRRTLRPLLLAIVLDCTESMTPFIQGMILALDGFLAILESAAFQVKVGLVLYRDERIGEMPELHEIGVPVAELRRILKGVKAQGGGDVPESALPATMRAIELLSACPDARAHRVVLHITDAPPHLDEGPTPESVTAALLQNGITYCACAPREIGVYVGFANSTGGWLSSIQEGLTPEQIRDSLLTLAYKTVSITLPSHDPELGAEMKGAVRDALQKEES